MKFKVRPFKLNVRGVDAEGTIEGNYFIVSFYGVPFPIPIIQLGCDKSGPYAIVQERELTLSDGFVFKVDVMPDEDMPYGCIISFERRDDESLKALALKSSIDLSSVTLMTPPKQFVGVTFDFTGKIDGDAGGLT